MKHKIYQVRGSAGKRDDNGFGKNLSFHKIKGQIFVFKPVSILLVLLAGWIILSQFGFLPMAFSFPGKLSRQAYGSPYVITGYGFTNQLLREQNNDKYTLTPVGTFSDLQILNNTNISGNLAYFDVNEQVFYIMSDDDSIYKNVIGKKKLKRVWEGTNQVGDSIIHYDNSFIFVSTNGEVMMSGKNSFERLLRNESENTIYWRTEYTKDENGREVKNKIYDFRDMTEFLAMCETRKMSLNDLFTLLYMARCDFLEGWYPESGTAVYRYIEGGKTIFATYRIGDENPIIYNPVDLSNCQLISINETECYLYDYSLQEVFLWDFVTNNRKKLFDTPALSNVELNLQPDGSLFLAGIQDEENVFVYASAGNKYGSIKVGSGKNRHLAIGDNSFFYWADNNDYSGKFTYCSWTLE